jgi:hypothetical protein
MNPDRRVPSMTGRVARDMRRWLFVRFTVLPRDTALDFRPTCLCLSPENCDAFGPKRAAT